MTAPKPPDSFQLFKPIRNKIRKYDPVQIGVLISQKLHEVENIDFSEWKGWNPWYLTSLLKWGFEYGGEKYPLTNLDMDKLAELINMIHTFDGECGSPFLVGDKPGNLNKFLRTKAYQQFWLQIDLSAWKLARQYLLFYEYSSDEKIKNAFLEFNSISIIDFLDLSFLTWSWLAKNSANIFLKPKEMLKNTDFTDIVIDKYIDLLALNTEEVKTYLNARPKKINNFCFQLIEPTPFSDKPFLEIGDKLLVYSRKIFEKMIDEYIYDQIKNNKEFDYSEIFSLDMEKYINQALSNSKLSFLNEKDLKRLLPESKVTDFLITCDDCSVFLEVKSQDINPQVRVFPNDQQLINELEDSVIKAVTQAITLANNLSLQDIDNNLRVVSPPFLFIITYKNLYLGNGQMMWDEFLGRVISEKISDQEIDIHLIPPENIVVLSIDEFDLLLSCLQESTLSLFEVLKKMIEENSSLDTMKMNFSQHLFPFIKGIPKLNYLDSYFEMVGSRIEKRFKR